MNCSYHEPKPVFLFHLFLFTTASATIFCLLTLPLTCSLIACCFFVLLILGTEMIPSLLLLSKGGKLLDLNKLNASRELIKFYLLYSVSVGLCWIIKHAYSRIS